ncbi:MAG: VOC family protein [Sphingomonadales bacterium]
MTDALHVSAMVRSALIVSNLERSTAFYTNVLGFADVYWEGVLEGTSVEKLLGVPQGSQCRARILTPSPENMGMVGLFELSNPTPKTVQKSDTTSQVGEAFLVFYASDLDVVMERLTAGGYGVLCAPIPLEHDGKVKQREMGCLDPDGFKINLIEWDPDRDARPELTPGKA